MKNTFTKLLILGIVSFSIVLFGCKKDEEVKNNFTIDGTKVILNYGALDNLGVTIHNPLTYEFEIVLATSSISFNETEQDYTGIGSFIRMTVFSSDLTTLLPGTYTFDNFSSKDPLTINNASVGVDQDISIFLGEGFFPIKTGVVEVIRRGGIYVLNIELYTVNNIVIKGYYNGLLVDHVITSK